MSLENFIASTVEALWPIDDMDEENAKNKIIRPIIEKLGWHGQLEVDFEYKVGPKNKKGEVGEVKGEVDIALLDPKGIRGKKKIACLAELKRPRAKLKDHVGQLEEYSGYEKGTDLGVLTNAEEWWLYLLRRGHSMDERRFAVIKLDDDPKHVAAQLERFLGKENVLSGVAVHNASKALDERLDHEYLSMEAPDIWQSMLSEPDSKLVELVSKYIYSRAKDELVSDIFDETYRDPMPELVAEMLAETALGLTEAPVAPLKPIEEKRKQSLKPHVVALWGIEEEVSSWAEVMRAVAEIIVGRHGGSFYRIIKGNWEENKKMRISKNKDDLLRPLQIRGTEYWVYTNLSANGVITVAEQLIVAAGGKETDLHILDAEENELVRDAGSQKIVQSRSSNDFSSAEPLDLLAEKTPTEPTSVKPAKKVSRQTPKQDKVTLVPKKIVLWGDEVEVANWREVLMAVTEAINDKHGHMFYQVIKDNWGARKMYISPDTSDLRKPRQIKDSQYFVDLHWSAHDLVRLAYRLVVAAEGKENDLHIFDAKGNKLVCDTDSRSIVQRKP